MIKRKIFLIFVCFLIAGVMFSLNVLAENNNRNDDKGQENSQSQEQLRIMAFNEENNSRELNQERIENKIRNVEMNGLSVGEETENNKTKLKVKLSNGKNSEIKIMPETASETALNRLRLRVCNESNNCSIELKEVGKANEERQLAYEVQAERPGKVLGIFKTKMQIRVQVSAENGEVIKIKKPWWAFLTNEEYETN